MNAEETKIVEFLTTRPGIFVSATEVSKFLDRKKLDLDRNWARPILRRMEMDGILESNPFGEYRLRKGGEGDTNFKSAIGQPGISLGETTIIRLDDVA